MWEAKCLVSANLRCHRKGGLSFEVTLDTVAQMAIGNGITLTENFETPFFRGVARSCILQLLLREGMTASASRQSGPIVLINAALTWRGTAIRTMVWEGRHALSLPLHGVQWSNGHDLHRIMLLKSIMTSEVQADRPTAPSAWLLLAFVFHSKGWRFWKDSRGASKALNDQQLPVLGPLR